ncbi:MAG: ribose-phosphate pyrophosphokinase [Clostridia bacterium]|nr:ribose-phosphate pyrophosphokinase [Clostridia bacterium]
MCRHEKIHEYIIFGGTIMDSQYYGKLSIIGMRGCDSFVDRVNQYLHQFREGEDAENFIVTADCPRFGTGEAKGMLHDSMRGHDVYIISDCFNYGETYTMYGQKVPMSPDDHFADLKRVIGAIGGKARRISVIMPMLYEGRQHKRSARESLDCAMSLQELVSMGVSNIITFDAHDARVQNAIPLSGFDSVRTSYQMIKALVKKESEIDLLDGNTMVISPDEGGLTRCMYYSSVLGLDLGMFYKRRDYTTVVNGRNPIVAHEYLGNSVEGKNVIVVDDMIASGDSVFDICYQLKEKNAAKIFVFSTFGLFTAGLEKFDSCYKEGLFDRIYTTNLIYRTPELLSREWYCEVNMCKYVAYIVDTLNRDASTSDLLNPVGRIHALMDRVKAGEFKK